MSQSRNLLHLLFSNISKLSFLIIICATLCLVFGFFGWWALRAELELSFGDVVYRAIVGISLSAPFDKSAVWQGDWRLEIARWAGVLLIVFAASKTLLFLLGDYWRRKRAESRRDHWLIIGNSLFAHRLCDAAIAQNHRVNQLCCDGTSKQSQSKNLFTSTDAWSINNAVALGLSRARGIVVATGEDSTNRHIAREVRSHLPKESKQIIMASMDSTWLSMRIDEVNGQSGINIFSEAQVAVRRLHSKHPPFLLAKKSKHNRIHLLIINFSAFGEAVLIETLLSSLTIDLQKPAFTIVDPNADTLKNTLRMRYPELHHSAHLRFIVGQLEGDDHVPNRHTIDHLMSGAPITAIYCCANDDDKSMKSALLSQALVLKTGNCEAAVFYRQEKSPVDREISAGTRIIAPAQMISFGAVDDLVRDTGLFDDAVDEFAKAFHLAYQRIATQKKPANVSWQNLPEDKRDSNRRIVVHIPAKLHSMGVDLEPCLASTENRAQLLSDISIDQIASDDVLIEKLARLEHDRWMADRRINGWTYGEKRDDHRRIHPDLKAYEKLTAESKSYDREIIVSLMKLFSRSN